MENHGECSYSSSSSSSSCNTARLTSNWADLPEELLELIVQRLDMHVHLSRLRGVCRAWRSSLIDPTLVMFDVPLINLHLPPNLRFYVQRFYLLSPNTHDPFGLPWLARMTEPALHIKHLLNPIDISDYFYSYPYISASTDPFHCRIQVLHSVFSLTTWDGNIGTLLSRKTVFNIDLNSNYKLAVLAHLVWGNGEHLFLYRLYPSQWIDVPETDRLRVIDIACYKGKFYVFDLLSWRVGLIDPANPLVAMEFISAPGKLCEPIGGFYTVMVNYHKYFPVHCHLVPTYGALYLVLEVKYLWDKDTMLVFVLKEDQGNKEGCNWERVHSLNDHILFIGYDVAFALPSASTNLPQWKPNSICIFATRPATPMMFEHYQRGFYMPEGTEPLESLTYARYWMYFRLFNLQEEFLGCVPFQQLPKRIYTALFFPPPAWVRWRCPSLYNVEVRLDGLRFFDYHFFPFQD